MTPQDRALAAAFAGTEPFTPLIEEQCIAADQAYARAKDSGELRRRDDEVALALQIHDQHMLEIIGRAL